MSEWDRVNFVLSRDGPESTLKWIKQSYRAYRAGIYGGSEKTQWMRSREYRSKFIKALLVYRSVMYGGDYGTV